MNIDGESHSLHLSTPSPASSKTFIRARFLSGGSWSNGIPRFFIEIPGIFWPPNFLAIPRPDWRSSESESRSRGWPKVSQGVQVSRWLIFHTECVQRCTPSSAGSLPNSTYIIHPMLQCTFSPPVYNSSE